jgi:hypothetical protein
MNDMQRQVKQFGPQDEDMAQVVRNVCWLTKQLTGKQAFADQTEATLGAIHNVIEAWMQRNGTSPAGGKADT